MAQTGENLLVMRGTWIDPWVGKIPWRRAYQPTLVFLLGKFHGQRSLGGYSPQGGNESDTTEQLSTSTFKSTVVPATSLLLVHLLQDTVGLK